MYAFIDKMMTFLLFSLGALGGSLKTIMIMEFVVHLCHPPHSEIPICVFKLPL